MADVPLTDEGLMSAWDLGTCLDLDVIYHDHLKRCRDTADVLYRRGRANIVVENNGPLPWNMGSLFQGKEITEGSLEMARWYIYGNPYGIPPDGECFAHWRDRWINFIRWLKIGHSATGIVTHNRNIQYLYATQRGMLSPQIYDVPGPDFCSVHYYDQRTGHIEPWGGRNVPKGIYLIRHGKTEYGT